jgi:hypothetical protein
MAQTYSAHDAKRVLVECGGQDPLIAKLDAGKLKRLLLSLDLEIPRILIFFGGWDRLNPPLFLFAHS